MLIWSLLILIVCKARLKEEKSKELRFTMQLIEALDGILGLFGFEDKDKFQDLNFYFSLY